MPCEYSNSNQPIYGIVRDAIVGQFDRVDELNNRIQSRQFPDIPLEPAFSERPVSTKYNTSVGIRLASVKKSDTIMNSEPTTISHVRRPEYVMPIDAFNSNPVPKVNIQPYIDHNVQMNFNPATRVGPWRTYAKNVDVETSLQNRVDKLTSLDVQGYIPSKNSDLYNTYIISRPVEQKYNRLFETTSPIVTSIPVDVKNTMKNADRTRFSVNTRPRGINE